MLEELLGSVNKERALLYLVARDEAYATEIADFFATALTPVRVALERLEAGGVLASRQVGRARVYSFDPRYPFRHELCAFLEKVLSLYPERVRNELLGSH